MATMKLSVDKVVLHLAGKVHVHERYDFAEVVLNSGLDSIGNNPEFPSLLIGVTSESGDFASFSVNGCSDIDALRRYCEMTLEQFKAGHLE